MLVPFSEDIVLALHPLVTFLRSLPLPATHPSHPAANAIQTALSEAQRGYADMRSGWIRRCLESEAKRVVEGRGDGYASGKDTEAAATGIREGQEFGVWVERVIDVAAVCALIPFILGFRSLECRTNTNACPSLLYYPSPPSSHQLMHR